MKQLSIALALFCVLLWSWAEFFRAIPHLQESGVLKNFKLSSVAAFQTEVTVLNKCFVKPQRQVLHQASPYVGHFNDLAYVSNIDVLVTQKSLPNMSAKLTFDQPRRCFKVEGQLSAAEQAVIQQQVQHLSVIAANAQIANQIRRLKAGQRIQLQGDIVHVHSVKSGQAFWVGIGSAYAAQCVLLRITHIQKIAA